MLNRLDQSNLFQPPPADLQQTIPRGTHTEGWCYVPYLGQYVFAVVVFCGMRFFLQESFSYLTVHAQLPVASKSKVKLPNF